MEALSIIIFLVITITYFTIVIEIHQKNKKDLREIINKNGVEKHGKIVSINYQKRRYVDCQSEAIIEIEDNNEKIKILAPLNLEINRFKENDYVLIKVYENKCIILDKINLATLNETNPEIVKDIAPTELKKEFQTTAICKNCGAIRNKKDKFCSHCGRILEEQGE